MYVGGLSEFPRHNAAVGATFACIIANQFRDLKVGDRFYYENSPRSSPSPFTPPQLDEIRRVTLAHLMCNNFNLVSVQQNVFMMPNAYKFL